MESKLLGTLSPNPWGLSLSSASGCFGKEQEAAKMITASNRLATCGGAQVAPQQSLILRAGIGIIA